MLLAMGMSKLVARVRQLLLSPVMLIFLSNMTWNPTLEIVFTMNGCLVLVFVLQSRYKYTGAVYAHTTEMPCYSNIAICRRFDRVPDEEWMKSSAPLFSLFLDLVKGVDDKVEKGGHLCSMMVWFSSHTCLTYCSNNHLRAFPRTSASTCTTVGDEAFINIVWTSNVTRVGATGQLHRNSFVNVLCHAGFEYKLEGMLSEGFLLQTATRQWIVTWKDNWTVCSTNAIEGQSLCPLSIEGMHSAGFDKAAEYIKERKRDRELQYLPQGKWLGRCGSW